MVDIYRQGAQVGIHYSGGGRVCGPSQDARYRRDGIREGRRSEEGGRRWGQQIIRNEWERRKSKNNRRPLAIETSSADTAEKCGFSENVRFVDLIGHWLIAIVVSRYYCKNKSYFSQEEDKLDQSVSIEITSDDFSEEVWVKIFKKRFWRRKSCFHARAFVIVVHIETQRTSLVHAIVYPSHLHTWVSLPCLLTCLLATFILTSSHRRVVHNVCFSHFASAEWIISHLAPLRNFLPHTYFSFTFLFSQRKSVSFPHFDQKSIGRSVFVMTPWDRFLWEFFFGANFALVYYLTVSDQCYGYLCSHKECLWDIEVGWKDNLLDYSPSGHDLWPTYP